MTKLSMTLLVLLASALAAPAFASALQSRESSRKEHTVSTHNENWTWRHRENDITFEVTIRGRVEFNDDYSDIQTIPEGGSIRIVDERRGANKWFEAKNDSGQQTRSYKVDGRDAPFDAAARRWLATVLNDTIIQGGYDAKGRVQRLIRERGAAGVLEEISRLKGDYLKRIYLTELARSGNLDSQVARRAIALIGREVDSDYERATALLQFKEAAVNDEAAQAEYIRAVQGIDSDYERNRALLPLLKGRDVSAATVLFAIKAAAAIKSDYEKARLLLAAASARPDDESVRNAIIETANSMESDYERGRVLKAAQRAR